MVASLTRVMHHSAGCSYSPLGMYVYSYCLEVRQTYHGYDRGATNVIAAAHTLHYIVMNQQFFALGIHCILPRKIIVIDKLLIIYISNVGIG